MSDCNFNMRTVGSLKDYTFVIPYFQRGYKWRPKDVERLLEDLKEFVSDDNPKIYCLQPITVKKIKDGEYEVIDGQQRLTTLYLIYRCLSRLKSSEKTDEGKWYEFDYMRDTKQTTNGEDGESVRRSDFLKKIGNDDEIDASCIDFYYISQAFHAIKEWFGKENNENLAGDFKNILVSEKADEKSIQILWYVANGEMDGKEEDSHQIFSSLNSGKIPLTNTDLIKALLLSESTGLDNREMVAAQFSSMERAFAEDRFWYMWNREDVNIYKGQTRLDFLFNAACGKEAEYKNDQFASFFEFERIAKNKMKMEEKFKKARQLFQKLRDIYNEPHLYHYFAFLCYCGERKNLLDKMRNGKINVADLKEEIKKEIRDKLNISKVKDLSYSNGPNVSNILIKIFVLHNIETILQRYDNLKEGSKAGSNLKFAFEFFPFDLLYKQKWDIEHIDSQTENACKNEEERKEFFDSICADYANDDWVKENKDDESKIVADEKKFQGFYRQCKEKFEKSDLEEEDKNSIGNLVLLGSHTNRSFHNSLFPRKRRIVIAADGLKNGDEKKKVEPEYVPICTKQVYLKAYNSKPGVKMNSWTKEDFDLYLADMKEKLEDYFVSKIDGEEK